MSVIRVCVLPSSLSLRADLQLRAPPPPSLLLILLWLAEEPHLRDERFGCLSSVPL